MKLFQLELTIVTVFFAHRSQSKIMRNNALMTKMVSNYHQKDNNINLYGEAERSGNGLGSREDRVRSRILSGPRFPRTNGVERISQGKVLNIMQNVLCRNFPNVPCNIIMKDKTLNNLIDKSIKQIAYKQMQTDRPTPAPQVGLTLFPVINSEDLSNFLEVSNTGYFDDKQKNTKKRKRKIPGQMQNHRSDEAGILKKEKFKGMQDIKVPELYNGGRKKMRTFFPHKIKLKDQGTKHGKSGYTREFSEENFSMSIQLPEMKYPKKREQLTQRFNYKTEGEQQPVWRIDYLKHGVPSLNMFRYSDERLGGGGRAALPGPSVVVDRGRGEGEAAPRKDVLHSDVYIKKSFQRQSGINLHSDSLD